MHIGEHAKILDAARADVVDQALDAAEILDPQRHRRMREQAERIILAVREADGAHSSRSVTSSIAISTRSQRLLMPGQNSGRAAGCRGARPTACS